MEARIAKLESDVTNIRESLSDVKHEIRGLRSDARGDFRLIFGTMISGAIGIVALLSKGFGWI